MTNESIKNYVREVYAEVMAEIAEAKKAAPKKAPAPKATPKAVAAPKKAPKKAIAAPKAPDRITKGDEEAITKRERSAASKGNKDDVAFYAKVKKIVKSRLGNKIDQTA